ncbi:MAG: C_GCAxxG_C_C family protein [Thermoplasmata archaeon]|nr:C_GCAxxG_C_C family protein [Thermoplasmata archaeon]
MLSNLGSTAEELFKKGFNCAEALSSAVAEDCHIESRAIPHIATPFGAGMGGKGNACGCLTGGIMGIGLMYGRSDPTDNERKKLAYEKTKLFYDKFVERFGSTNCIDLCGADISTEEGLKRFHDEGLREKCGKFVHETGDLLAKIL